MKDADTKSLTAERLAGIRQRAEQDVKKPGWREAATARDLLDLLDHVKELRDLISHQTGSVICVQWWELPDWCSSKEDVDAATDEQLQDLMGYCHVEGSVDEDCLPCYAYGVVCARERAHAQSLFVEGATVCGPSGTLWTCIKITDEAFHFSGPKPCRGITIVKREDLGTDWQPVVPA